MSLTILLAGFFFILLVIVFGLSFLIKGWKIALITTGISFVLFAALFLAIIQVIVSSMN
ncbi:MAG TPA: hypothetical protein VJ821_11940 [Anaerolineales bacterium]|nr:hypothetical protein [Anaerolineales bacterium]